MAMTPSQDRSLVAMWAELDVDRHAVTVLLGSKPVRVPRPVGREPTRVARYRGGVFGDGDLVAETMVLPYPLRWED